MRFSIYLIPASKDGLLKIRRVMLIYILSIFLSAFLLFQVQPMIAKYILPWFGGITTVWSTVMLFFQILLTGGYAYGYYLIGKVKTGRQWKIHAVLLAVSVGVLFLLAFLWASPITAPASWKPHSIDNPIGHIFILLLISIGLPYFMLSTNSPLVQAWFTRALPGKSPYRLYALSNLGSLLALITYPVIVEPLLPLRWQGWVWSGLYIVFASLAAAASLSSRKTIPAASTSVGPELAPRQKAGMITLWITLSATASVVLLAVTSQITQEVASIPFLWVLPLTIYLLSFILTFESERWYNRILFIALLLFSSIGYLYTVIHPYMNYLIQLGLYTILMFSCFMVCHGELYRLRPNPTHLTMFYLMVSIGGAVGGIFINFIAPLIFDGYWELNYGLAVVWILLMVMTFVRPTPIMHHRLKFSVDLLVGISAVSMLIITIFLVNGLFSDSLVAKRNFYGVLRIRQTDIGNDQQVYALMHGITVHGIQFVNPMKRAVPTGYYTESSGVGLAILNHPQRGHGMKIGLLGLGIGTLAAYSLLGDEYLMYEINPAVANLAKGEDGYFTFLQDGKANETIILGDARISLEREFAEGQMHQFDVLALDAFNSDSIPIHLLTREAFKLYLDHLAENGIIAAHITNKHLDLLPVLWQLSQHFNLEMVVITTDSDIENGGFPSKWVLLSPDSAVLNNPAITNHADSLEGFTTNIRLWTDDYSNLYQILR